MKVVIPHQTRMVERGSLPEVAAKNATTRAGRSGIWTNDDLSPLERSNVALVSEFWDCWKTVPVDLGKLGRFFAPTVTVRTGWRGEHVVQGRDAVLAMYAAELKRQVDHEEASDFRFPVVIAKGPIVFHTWIWIARSEKHGYHIERPMAAMYLITDGLIERWDSYCTGPESEPGYVGGKGPDGL